LHFGATREFVAANSLNRFGAVVIDEDMVLDGFWVAESLKMVSSLPILLVCNKGSEGKANPAGVDWVTPNSSRPSNRTRI
jgi:hypothetical protein